MSKQKQRKKQFVDISNPNTKTEIKRKLKPRVEIVPRNTKQEEYLLHLNNPEKRMVFAVGPAGTGKTLLGTLQAIKLFKEKQIDKILITRPAVGAGEQLGYLPGDLNNKMEPWCRPIFDIFEDYYYPKDIKFMIDQRVIEICPLPYLRGRTFKNSVIIFDEAQNCTSEQMKMVLTRLGENSKLFVTGDLRQSDFKKSNGLADFTERLFAYGESDKIEICQFQRDHIERDSIVSEVLEIYGEAA